MSIVPWTKGYTNDAGPFLSFAILDSDTGESFLHTGRLSGYSWRDRKLTFDSIDSSPPLMDVKAYHPMGVLLRSRTVPTGTRKSAAKSKV